MRGMLIPLCIAVSLKLPFPNLIVLILARRLRFTTLLLIHWVHIL